MVSPEQVAALIKAGLPDAEVQVQDLTGTRDHYQVVVVSAEFVGKRLIQQHQMVNRAVQAEMATGELHALTMKTYTPEEWATQSA
jgi:acid stress-induced BolA-like protein IbaG/YrbA